MFTPDDYDAEADFRATGTVLCDNCGSGSPPDPSRRTDMAKRYPMVVALPGGRVRHAARLRGDGPTVTTLCGKPGIPVGDGEGLPYCSACAKKPNPQDQRTHLTAEEA